MRRALTLGLLALGCGGTPPEPSRAWTMFDIAAAYGAMPRQQVVVGAEGVPDGLDPSLFITAAGPVLPIRPAFTEGSFSAYVTTNLWANVPEVWIQPMYIFVTGWESPVQHGTPVTTQPWVFTVGPTSRFHSPFWRVYWVELPNPAPRTRYTSSDQILADKLVVHEGPGRLVSIVPAGTSIDAITDTSPWFDGKQPAAPLTRVNKDYLDGQLVSSLDFGYDRFEWNDDLEVVEQPLFLLYACPSGTGCQRTNTPNIGGTGPLFARRPAIAPGGHPRFGSFWRLYVVTLPNDENIQVFIPPGPQYDTSRDEVTRALYGVKVGTPGFTPDSMTVAKYFMKVALNGKTCFADAASFAGCRWLDSQAAIEDNLPTAIARTGITVTCPFIDYADQPVTTP